jgi:plastocyanin
MRIAIVAFAALLAVMPLAMPRAQQAGGGTITGAVVVLDGSKAGNCSDVWVYLRRKRGAQPTPAPVTETISQEDTEFMPHVRVVPMGSTIAFPNKDTTEHNVFSPDAIFDLQRYRKPTSKTWKFPAVGDFNIFCDLHKNMAAVVKVVHAPKEWITVAQRGLYTLKNIPAGRYEVTAWRPHSEEVLEVIEVADGETTNVPELHLQEKTAPNHANKNGGNYKSYPDGGDGKTGVKFEKCARKP